MALFIPCSFSVGYEMRLGREKSLKYDQNRDDKGEGVGGKAEID